MASLSNGFDKTILRVLTVVGEASDFIYAYGRVGSASSAANRESTESTTAAAVSAPEPAAFPHNWYVDNTTLLPD